MTARVYFNENDPYAVDWLRAIWPDATVDERSIHDVRPADLAGYTRCHFFAGIGTWEYALQLAGWPDDQEIWTGSCPCQPFSVAGRGAGADDARHLWPEFARLIDECRPERVVGEQVPGAIGKGWLDTVFADLAPQGYTGGAVVLGAHSTGAPHIRQRLYWVADASRNQCGSRGRRTAGEGRSEPERSSCEPTGLRDASGLADDFGSGLEVVGQQHARGECETAERGGAAGGLGYPLGGGDADDGPGEAAGATSRVQGSPEQRERLWPDPWQPSDLIPCRDGKWRPAKSGIRCLVNGHPFRLADGRTRQEASRPEMLRCIGNAIVPTVAAVFIRAYLDTKEAKS